MDEASYGIWDCSHPFTNAIACAHTCLAALLTQRDGRDDPRSEEADLGTEMGAGSTRRPPEVKQCGYITESRHRSTANSALAEREIPKQRQ